MLKPQCTTHLMTIIARFIWLTTVHTVTPTETCEQHLKRLALHFHLIDQWVVIPAGYDTVDARHCHTDTTNHTAFLGAKNISCETDIQSPCYCPVPALAFRTFFVHAVTGASPGLFTASYTRDSRKSTLSTLLTK